MSDKLNKLNDTQMENVVGGISRETALDIALKDAKLTKDKIFLKKAKLDLDDGIKKYEIEFIANGREYEYDINAKNGDILGFEFD